MGNETAENAPESGKRSLVSPVPVPAKRLKQACLPFKLITDPVVKTSTPLKTKRQSVDGPESTTPVKQPGEGASNVEATVDNCKENESPKETNKRRKLADSVEEEQPHSKDNSVVLVDLTDDVEDKRHLDDVDLEKSTDATTSQTDLDTTGNREQLQISLLDDDVEKVNVSGSASASSSLIKTPSAAVTGKKVKRLKKTKRDPKEELEKAKRMEERKRIQEEKDKLKAELHRLREERSIERLKKEKEKLRKREQEELERQDKLKQKEEERKKKQEVLEAKKKEKLDLEDEKKKAEEEEERKKNKVKAAFASFFVKKEPVQTVWQKPKNLGTFLPFQVKENMRLAPVHRNTLANTADITRKMDEVLSTQCDTALYLEEFKKLKKVPRKSSRTWAAQSKDVEMVAADYDMNKVGKKQTKAKLLQFEENIRPPYWGTWCKRSNVINPRNPLRRDEKYLDYEVDSNEEWEEEEPGESLSHTEDEKESEDDYEVDNEFFVPHGYLSNEEGQEEDKQRVSPDTLKAQLKLKEQEFEKDRKKKCMQIKPLVFGCIWMDEGEDVMNKALKQYAAVMTDSSSINTRFTLDKTTKESEKTKTNKTPASIKYQKEVPEDVMPDFIRLVHGNRHSFKIISSEFAEYLLRADAEKKSSAKNVGEGSSEVNDEKSVPKNVSNNNPETVLKLSVKKMRKKIREIASWIRFPDTGALHNKFAWFVNKKCRDRYKLTDLPIPNQWKYCTQLEEVKNVESTPVLLKPIVKLKRIPESFFLKKSSTANKLDNSDIADHIDEPKLDKSDIDDPKLVKFDIDEPKLYKSDIADQIDEPKLDKSVIADHIDETKLDKSNIADQIDEPKLDKSNIADQIDEPKLDKSNITDQIDGLKLDKSDIDESKLDNSDIAAQIDDPKLDTSDIVDQIDEPKLDKSDTDEPKLDNSDIADQIDEPKLDSSDPIVLNDDESNDVMIVDVIEKNIVSEPITSSSC